MIDHFLTMARNCDDLCRLYECLTSKRKYLIYARKKDVKCSTMPSKLVLMINKAPLIFLNDSTKQLTI